MADDAKTSSETVRETVNPSYSYFSSVTDTLWTRYTDVYSRFDTLLGSDNFEVDSGLYLQNHLMLYGQLASLWTTKSPANTESFPKNDIKQTKKMLRMMTLREDPVQLESDGKRSACRKWWTRFHEATTSGSHT